MQIGISLNVTGRPAASGGAVAPPPPPDPIPATPDTAATGVAIAPLAHDEWVYDSGAARGLNEARLPVQGTAEDNGATILARAVRWDTRDPVSDWQEVGPVVGGAWSGTVGCPRASQALVIEVAQASGGSVFSGTDRRYVSGHVIDAWGQSWFTGIFDFSQGTAYGDIPGARAAYPIADADALQVVGIASAAGAATTGTAERRFVRDSGAVNTQAARMANYLAAAAPGERFCIAVQARAGTGWRDLIDDASDPATTRSWADDVAPVAALARTDGAEAGLVLVDWFHNPRSAGIDATELLYLTLFARTPDGTAVAPGPGTFHTARSGASYAVNRSLDQLYDWDLTRVQLNGPHRNEISESDVGDAAGAFVDAGGAQVPQLAGADQVRAAYAAVAADTTLVDAAGGRIVLGGGLQANHIAARRQDEQHPTPSFGPQGFETEDGDAEFERYTAYAILEALGRPAEVVADHQPAVSGAVLTPAYTEIAFANAAGPVDVTTTRLLRGLAPIAAPAPHQTEVMGFDRAGVHAGAATIAGGKVRLGPLGGAPTVTLNDAAFLQFGRGIGAGQRAKDADLDNAAWANFPGWAKPGLSANAEGARLVPARVPAPTGTFPVDVSGVDLAPGISWRAAGDSRFESPGTLSAMIHGLPAGVFRRVRRGTLEIVCTLPETAETADLYLFRLSSGPWVRFRGDTRRVIGAPDGVASLISDDGAYTPGAQAIFRLSWDADAGTAWLTTPAGTLSAPYGGTGADLTTLFVLDTGSVTDVGLSAFRLWEDAAGGAAPSSQPVLTLSGGPDYLNVHPFKAGADFAAAPAGTTPEPVPDPGGAYGIVTLGQSEYHRLLLSAQSNIGTAAPVADEAALTLYWYDLDDNGLFDGVRNDPVTNANPVSRWAVELSNALATLAPGARFHLCSLTFAGTGLDELLNDATTTRHWADDKATYDAFAAGFGAAPDLALMSWQNTDSAQIAGRLGDAWWMALTGTGIEDGAPIAPGTRAYNVDYDHLLSELWDTDTVPFAFLMHRYDVLNNATDQADYDRFRDVRVAMDRVVANPRNQARAVPLVRGIDPVAYRNPVEDQSHAEKSADGAVILAQMWGYNIVHLLGLGGTTAPRLDEVDWTPAALTLGTSAGALTTARTVRGETVPAGQPKIAQLFFRAAEAPGTLHEIPDAAIALAGGQIRIDAAALLAGIGSGRGAAGFIAGDRVEVAPAGAGNNDLQDFADDTWKDYPGIADTSGVMDIVPLQPVSGPLVSTLAPAGPPVNLLAASGRNDLGNAPNGTDQGGGWYTFPRPQEFADSSQGHVDMSAFVTGATTGTFVVDCDRVEGTLASNFNAASVRARGVNVSGTQQITVNGLWSQPSINSLGSNPPTSFGWAPLPEGRARIWMHFTYDSGLDNRAEFHAMANVGGAYARAGVYHGALTPATIAGLVL